ncbi:oxetanocin [Candidatus Shapirobacteria bacterium CG_4_8_14_3_um_filter_35_11]|uniref:5'-deoxynucleotidase n=3 Tax=Candidatus Shapironibacteriota TaxID=1752721 RepID=A0A2M7BQ41_9BACT|nr:MAG: oxetanocin [Candidatus Shapirobacteria bacterium CG03_land_8_20_14_0_80_35_14]PIX68265.1 MAG: oxetanocin [Candidatus Shapirobacteria bacterium CG_4_10_14_3_um_filter_35_13]PJC80827.1 MAG: oxetanocin [Candidatus Shapirobacteria bacterium CG_4_8_14_3_um_filter_35_11]
MNYQELLKILVNVSNLKKTKRTGWIKKGIVNVESVADHSYQMAVMTIFISEKLSLNFEKMVKMALIHDVAEGVIGDIIWEQGINTIGSHKNKTKLEQKAMKKIFKNNLDLYQLWDEFEKQETREAKVIKCIDKLEMLIQAGEYESAKENTKSLQEFWDNVEKYLKDSELEDFYKEIKHFYK